MRDPGDFVTDYALSFDAMAARGWAVQTVDWRAANLDWDAYGAVYICTPWDYPQHLEQFLEVLQGIDASHAVLVNPLSLVHWTLQKTYLRDLQQRGAAIVPSRWHDEFDTDALRAAFDAFDSERIIIKPVIGANAQHTYVLQKELAADTNPQLREIFTRRPFFLQPFIDSVQTEGEYSLFYFAGEYSHAIQKVPRAGDFRVQEEHGGDIRRHDASAALRAAGERVMALIRPCPVYARADFVRAAQGEFLVMELELIEPSLYLRMDSHAAERFAAAFDAYVAGEIA